MWFGVVRPSFVRRALFATQSHWKPLNEMRLPRNQCLTLEGNWTLLDILSCWFCFRILVFLPLGYTDNKWFWMIDWWFSFADLRQRQSKDIFISWYILIIFTNLGRERWSPWFDSLRPSYHLPSIRQPSICQPSTSTISMRTINSARSFVWPSFLGGQHFSWGETLQPPPRVRYVGAFVWTWQSSAFMGLCHVRKPQRSEPRGVWGCPPPPVSPQGRNIIQRLGNVLKLLIELIYCCDKWCTDKLTYNL